MKRVKSDYERDTTTITGECEYILNVCSHFLRLRCVPAFAGKEDALVHNRLLLLLLAIFVLLSTARLLELLHLFENRNVQLGVRVFFCSNKINSCQPHNIYSAKLREQHVKREQ
jgi:hypothetical protein